MIFKCASAVLVLALAAIAFIVSLGQAGERRMWLWIVAYWIVLTAKNLCDLAGLI